jgi:hypothetical protein
MSVFTEGSVQFSFSELLIGVLFLFVRENIRSSPALE